MSDTTEDRPASLFDRVRSIVLRALRPPPELEREGVAYFRERVLRTFLGIAAVFLQLLVFPVVVIAIRNGIWLLAVMNLATYVVAMGLFFLHGLPYQLRATVTIAAAFAAGCYITALTGFLSSGPVLFCSVAIFAAILLGFRAALVALVVSGATMALLVVLIHDGIIAKGWPHFEAPWQVVVVPSTVLLVSLILAAAVAVLVRGLNALATKERIAHEDLQREQAALLQAQKKLQREIATREKAELVLRESEERYRSLVESTLDGFFICEIPSGKFLFLNATICDLCGYTLEEGTLLKVWDVVVASDHERLRAVIGARLANERLSAERSIYQIEKKDGSTFRAELSTSLVRYHDGVAVQGTLRDADVTLHLQRQLLRAQRFEAIGTLAGGMAHNFNNLLMGIQSCAALMQMDLAPSHSHSELLTSIQQNIESGMALTRQMLGFALGGKYEIKPTNLNAILSRMAKMFAQTHRELTLRQRYNEELWTVEVDRGQLEQALMNLLVNASQAMPEGGDLSISSENVVLDAAFVASYEPEPGRYVKISVGDSGVGMDEATLERIFEPFFSTKEVGQGTGLGLASTYGIVQNHGGIIEVESEPGKGTTFELYLPASDKKAATATTRPTKIEQGKGTILMVDDEPLLLSANKRILERRLGYEVITAASGREALEVFAAGATDIDLVILDMIMPGMGGSEVFERLRELRPDLKILLSSGYALEGQAQEILDRGCDGFIQKPFTVAELSQKLRELLGPSTGASDEG